MVLLEDEVVDSSTFLKFMRGGFNLMDLSDIGPLPLRAGVLSARCGKPFCASSSGNVQIPHTAEVLHC